MNFEEFHQRIAQEVQLEKAPELSGDSTPFSLACALDEEFGGHYHHIQMDQMKKICAVLNSAKGRVIKGAIYEPLPFDAQTNPLQNIGAFTLLLEPQAEDAKAK